MFSIYGISGPTFRGTLEEMERLPAVNGLRRVRPIDEQDRERSTFASLLAASEDPPLPRPAGEAIDAYQSILHRDAERGPLYLARQIMRRQVIVVGAEDPVERAFQVLLDNEIRQAPVLDAGRVVGIVGERNLLRALNVEAGQVRDVLDRRVRELMSSPVVCADPVTDIRRIARVMRDNDVDGVPVVDAAGALNGFISRSDILSAVVTEPPLSLWR
ncbi:CBS domain-containing protein [Rhodocyclus tenuis]|uniref:CBS domain-containing protein n=1 Tax=Rhodocyclus tenuis TaxID=1066 RepID=A0A840GDD5_RHOTE|nr:CBS domain-containing protein [Rhodocyclus tenuis]MBB4248648.1 CBS domain-containing protein [Rhodocyclus tenuis]